jgi:tetratricopeptide (TPR) repeat protein
MQWTTTHSIVLSIAIFVTGTALLLTGTILAGRTFTTHYLAKGEQLLEQKEYTQAMQAFALVGSLGTFDGARASKAYQYRAMIYVHKGQFDHAESQLERAIAVSKKNPESYNMFSELLFEQREYEAAERIAEEGMVAHRKHQTNASLLVSAAKAEIALQKWEEAIAHIELALSANPDDEQVQWYHALIQLANMNDEQQIGSSVNILERLRLQATNQNIQEKADTLYEIIKAQETYAVTDINTLLLFAFGFIEVDEPHLGLHLAMQAKNIDDTIRDPWLYTGYALYRLGDASGARQALTTALEHDPQHGFTQYLLALVLGEQQQYAEAEERFEKAIASGYRHQDALRDYARLLAVQQKFTPAANRYEQAQEFGFREDITAERFWIELDELNRVNTARILAHNMQSNAITPTQKVNAFSMSALCELADNNPNKARAYINQVEVIGKPTAISAYTKAIMCIHEEDAACANHYKNRAIDIDDASIITAKARAL